MSTKVITKKSTKADMLERISILEEIVEECEWCQPTHNGSPSCPWCGNQQHWGHSENCKLKEVIDTV